MPTTTAPGWVIPAEQLTWDRDDWIDAYQDHNGDTYASSVIWASTAEIQAIHQPYRATRAMGVNGQRY